METMHMSSTRRNLLTFQQDITDQENRLRLGELVSNRRKRMKKTQAEFAKESNVSLSTLKTIENSNHPTRGLSRKSISGVEEALGWLPGSVKLILNGGKPIEDERVSKALYVDHEVWMLINKIQFHEGRNVNDVLEDALSLYWGA